MSQMFCTLKQAADKLKTTEADIKAMVHDGLLREFRDGSSRLLKVADLVGLAVAPDTAAGERRADRTQRKAGSSQPRRDSRASAVLGTEIQPPAPAATARTNSPLAVAPGRPTGQRRMSHTSTRKPAACPRRQTPPRAVVISPELPPERTGPQTCDMSLRQWIWTGLIDDNPIAIFILFGIVLLGICALAGAAYLLLHTL